MNTNPTCPSPFKRFSIDWAQVVYLEGDGNYTTFVFTDGTTWLTSRTIGVFVPLVPEHFVRVHKGCIVNCNFVRSLDKITKSVVLSNKIKLKVARRRWCELKRILWENN
jgi:DNA-binding LytR/AlgR family response regulator